MRSGVAVKREVLWLLEKTVRIGKELRCCFRILVVSFGFVLFSQQAGHVLLGVGLVHFERFFHGAASWLEVRL